MKKRMLAAVFRGIGEVALEEIPTPVPGTGEILIRVRACAICGTDGKIIRGEKTRGLNPPSILGHEFVGEISALGGHVSGFREGDRVAVSAVVPCLRCFYCCRGMENLCLNMRAMGYEYNGGFAEYAIIPDSGVRAGILFPIPEGLPFQAAALMEPLGCCLNGFRRLGLSVGDTLLIFGAGPIGLFHVQLGVRTGLRVMAVEPIPERRKKAQEFGAGRCLDPERDDVMEAVMEETGGNGVDGVIIAVSRLELFSSTLPLLRRGGILSLFAGFPGDEEVRVSGNIIHYNEIRVVGSSGARRVDCEDALYLLASGRVDGEGLISHSFPLGEIREALRIAFGREGLKVVLLP